MNKASFETILVIRSGALGDVLLTVPLLQTLKGSFPRARTTLWSRGDPGRFLKEAGVVDEFGDIESSQRTPLFQPTSLADTSQAFPGGEVEKHDLIVCYMNAPRSVFVENVRCLAEKEFIGWPAKPPEDFSGPAWEFFLSALAELDGIVRPAEFRLSVPDRFKQRARDLYSAEFGGSGIVIHPGSGGEAKRWPLERFLQLGERLNALSSSPVLFIVGPDDLMVANEITSATTIENPSLSHLAGILSCCRLFVGNDSGVSHLAGLLGVPSVVVFGPTDERVWRPCGPYVRTVSSARKCRPCNDSRGDCPTADCLRDVSVEQVLDACGIPV